MRVTGSSAFFVLALGCAPATPPPVNPGALAAPVRFEGGRPVGSEKAARLPPTAPPAGGQVSSEVTGTSVVRNRTSDTFGGAGPLALVAASEQKLWAVSCEVDAKSDADAGQIDAQGELQGPAPRTYYAELDRHEEIDAFAGSDATGRFVAFVRAGQLVLRDAALGTELELSARGADASDDAAPYQSHRAVSFAPDVARVAYLRIDGKQSRVAVLDLTTGVERVFDLGAEVVARIRLRPGRRYLEIAAVRRDTNRNKRLDWPFPKQKGPKSCPSPVPSYAVWSYPGDDPDMLLLDLETGTLTAPAGFVASFGAAWLGRSENAEFVVSSADERPAARITTDKCLARALYLDSSRRSLVFGCAKKPGERRNLFLQYGNQRKDLGIDVAAFESDAIDTPGARWLPLYPRDDTYLLDLETANLIPLEQGTRVLGIGTTGALVERKTQLYFVQLEKPKLVETALGRKRPPLSNVLKSSAFVALGSELYDLERGQYLGSFPQAPLALSPTGEGLVPERSADSTRLATGPVRWITPQLDEK